MLKKARLNLRPKDNSMIQFSYAIFLNAKKQILGACVFSFQNEKSVSAHDLSRTYIKLNDITFISVVGRENIMNWLDKNADQMNIPDFCRTLSEANRSLVVKIFEGI